MKTLISFVGFGIVMAGIVFFVLFICHDRARELKVTETQGTALNSFPQRQNSDLRAAVAYWRKPDILRNDNSQTNVIINCHPKANPKSSIGEMDLVLSVK